MVWADTEELGCGMVYYKVTLPLTVSKQRQDILPAFQGSQMYETLIVCNYAVAGNLIGDIAS